MASRSYFDVVASLAAGETLAYANLSRDEQQHIRSLKAEALVKSVAKNGKAVLLNHPSALIRLTDDGSAYAEMLAEAGVIVGTTPAASGAQPKAEAEPVGRHAKPSAYADVDARIAARESGAQPKAEAGTRGAGSTTRQAVKPAKKPRTRKAGKVTKSQGKPRKPVRQILDPQDLDALRRLAAVLPQIDQFTDQYIR